MARQATGLIPYNPSAIFENLSARPHTDNGTLPSASTTVFSRQIPPTPGNVEQVSEAVELISLFRHQTLNSSKLALLHKALKTARLAMADRIVLNCTNTELLAANT